MEEEKGNLSRHVGQRAQANGQRTAYCLRLWGWGWGGRRMGKEIPSTTFNSLSIFMQRVRVVIYWVVLGVCTLDFTRKLICKWKNGLSKVPWLRAHMGAPEYKIAVLSNSRLFRSQRIPNSPDGKALGGYQLRCYGHP